MSVQAVWVGYVELPGYHMLPGEQLLLAVGVATTAMLVLLISCLPACLPTQTLGCSL
jgi:hypothetical protein